MCVCAQTLGKAHLSDACISCNVFEKKKNSKALGVCVDHEITHVVLFTLLVLVGGAICLLARGHMSCKQNHHIACTHTHTHTHTPLHMHLFKPSTVLPSILHAS